ncbi:MAG TPA: hypothetical protein VFU49_06545 [Ktedonobacteraceae bacterium]|nr:hypothetical protein [Ktedonobacteraceae bacterium]
MVLPWMGYSADSRLEEVRQALSQFEVSQGFVAPAEFLLGVGSKKMRPC